MAKVRSWVGLDVHAAKVIACVVDAESGEMTTHRMGGETAAVVAFCVALPGPTRVAYEARSLSRPPEPPWRRRRVAPRTATVSAGCGRSPTGSRSFLCPGCRVVARGCRAAGAGSGPARTRCLPLASPAPAPGLTAAHEHALVAASVRVLNRSHDVVALAGAPDVLVRLPALLTRGPARGQRHIRHRSAGSRSVPSHKRSHHTVPRCGGPTGKATTSAAIWPIIGGGCTRRCSDSPDRARPMNDPSSFR
jgi:hypothetical protein